ncbi:hypothetical protein GCM10009000_095930 [Halobacterium noricense]
MRAVNPEFLRFVDRPPDVVALVRVHLLAVLVELRVDCHTHESGARQYQPRGYHVRARRVRLIRIRGVAAYMRKVRLDDLDSRMGPADRNVPLTDALGAANAAFNYYELDAGDSFAYGLHSHENQEEIFHVLAGTVTFETLDVQQSATPDDEPASTEEVEVGAGELVRFGPGEFQRGVNRGDERVRALAIGAPQEAGDTEILRECEDCGETTTQTIELADDHSEIRAVCEACGAVTGRFD